MSPFSIKSTLIFILDEGYAFYDFLNRVISLYETYTDSGCKYASSMHLDEKAPFKECMFCNKVVFILFLFSMYGLDIGDQHARLF